MKVKIEVEGKIIERVVKFKQLGNFVMNIVRYKNERYLVGDGDEYLRGYDKVFSLGRKLSWANKYLIGKRFNLKLKSY